MALQSDRERKKIVVKLLMGMDKGVKERQTILREQRERGTTSEVNGKQISRNREAGNIGHFEEGKKKRNICKQWLKEQTNKANI